MIFGYALKLMNWIYSIVQNAYALILTNGGTHWNRKIT